MNRTELLTQIALGEDSTHQFKVDMKNGESLAAEMAAFANSNGGTLFFGVADDGSAPGLSILDVSRINQLISNVASQQVRSPLTVKTENISLENSRIVIVLTVPKGIDKPYFDKNGVIWLKTGSDKRRVNSKEELRRLFQISDQFHADELPTKAGIEKLDKLRFRDFLKDVYKLEYPDSSTELMRLLQNMNLATDEGKLNLAGVLMFAERPEWIKPQFVIKAIRYPGNKIHVSDYLDSEDFSGSLRKVFDDAMGFVMRNLQKVQAGYGINEPGRPEIAEAVIEELLVNALVHRDYLISAPIRLFIFDNRIEIISPGHLPNNLTVEKIRTGNSNIRNPILVSYVAKGLLPYHGLGSGIKRALELWPQIDFLDDQEGCLFTVTIHRKATKDITQQKSSPESSPKNGIEQKSSPQSSPENGIGQKSSPQSSLENGFGKKSSPESIAEVKSSLKTEEQIIELVRLNGSITTEKLGEALGITKRAILKQIDKLKGKGRLRRIGPTKSGHWEIIE